MEILDWYHLMENLGQVGGSAARLERVKAHLWQGEVGLALAEFEHWQHRRADNFKAYFRQNRHRIVNYDYYSEPQKLDR